MDRVLTSVLRSPLSRLFLVVAIVWTALGSGRATAATLPAASPPTIIAVLPQELDPELAPADNQLTIVGTGFPDGTLVRLFYLQDDRLMLDLKPDAVTDTQISVTVGPEWFQALAQAAPPPTTLDISNPILPDAFSVEVLTPDGQVSNAGDVRIKRFSVRVDSIGVDGLLTIAAGAAQELLVTVERRGWADDVPLQVLAFEAPQIDRNSTDVQGGAGVQVPGIKGAAVIPAGEISARLVVSVAADVPPGSYQLYVAPALDGDVGAEGTGYLADLAVEAPVTINSGGTCVPPTCTPPTAPTNLAVEGSTLTSISLKWYTDPHSFDEYDVVQRRLRAVTTWTEVATVDPEGVSGWLTYSDSGLTPNTEYCYRVGAVNDGGRAYSAELCALTTDAPPPAPSNLVVTNRSDITIGLSWLDNAPNEQGYALQRRTATGSWAAIASWGIQSGTGGMAYTDWGLAPSTLYCYRVRVWNVYGEAYTPELCVTTREPRPAKPSNLVVTSKTPTSISLAWQDNATNELGFEILRRPTGAKWTTVGSQSAHDGIGGMMYTDTGLSPETSYCYQIKAWNLSGSSYSAELCATTPPLASLPAAPTGLTVTGNTDSSITLSWQDNATNELGFSVERKQGTGSWAQIANLGPHGATGQTGYTDSGLSPNTSYCYRVSAYNLYGSAVSTEACHWTQPPPAELTFSGPLALSPAAPRRNQAFTLSWYVCNQGQSPASNFTDTAQRDNVETVNRTVSTLAPGTCSREWVYYPSGLPAGSHYWYVSLDRYNSVPEGNESNNTAILSINIR